MLPLGYVLWARFRKLLHTYHIPTPPTDLLSFARGEIFFLRQVLASSGKASFVSNPEGNPPSGINRPWHRGSCVCVCVCGTDFISSSSAAVEAEEAGALSSSTAAGLRLVVLGFQGYTVKIFVFYFYFLRRFLFYRFRIVKTNCLYSFFLILIVTTFLV